VFKPNKFGQTQYSSFSKPSRPIGSYAGVGGKKYGYRTPGHGTNWGTSFSGGTGVYNKKRGLSKKALGLGVAAGFVGGAALGAAGTMATYSVYHRYHEFQRMMYMNNPLQYGGVWDDNYFSNYYSRNLCRFGCPPNSHCEWGFCECDVGFVKTYGTCQTLGTKATPRLSSFMPENLACGVGEVAHNSTAHQVNATSYCALQDINMVCNANLSTTEGMGRCECRKDMKWNNEAKECQIFMDVDCSTITYETPPSSAVLSAVEKAKAELASIASNLTQETLERTQTKEESLANSLLKQIDPKTSTADQIKEAFCRDIDAFSFEFQEVKDERPSLLCMKVPDTACAVGYDSSKCSGGWSLVLPEGQRKFRYWSSDWGYRNDMDVVGVRAGCTFTGFSGSAFNGNSVMVRAEQWDHWVVFSREAQYQHIDEDIESLTCHCIQAT